jgi:hypothetical protein
VNLRTGTTLGMLAALALFVGEELWFALDDSPDTVPLTVIVVDHVPMWLGFPLIVVFAVWLVVHFWTWWRRRRRT